MSVFVGILTNILEEGLIYGIMAMGVYITYKILDFPDLSVDGTFPLGACVAAALINAGLNPWLVCILAFLAGCAAGSVTGFLHVKLKITDLLSGILMMTALWSINLVITSGSAILPFFKMPTIFDSFPVTLLPEALYGYRVLIVVFTVALVVKLALDWFLKTKTGLLLRASGDNGQFVTSLARDQGKLKILGLAIGNGCTALAGCVLAQQAQSANINSGKGMVVMALAAVIIGTTVLRGITIMRATTMAVCGSIFYKACLSIAMLVGLPTNYLKLLMAVLLTVALVSSRRERKVGANVK